jgi:ABC-type glucose/galactose transport system permease subunit
VYDRYYDFRFPLQFNVPNFARGQLMLGDFMYPYYRLAMLAVASVALLLTWLLLNKTAFGKNMFAVGSNAVLNSTAVGVGNATNYFVGNSTALSVQGGAGGVVQVTNVGFFAGNSTANVTAVPAYLAIVRDGRERASKRSRIRCILTGFGNGIVPSIDGPFPSTQRYQALADLTS